MMMSSGCSLIIILFVSFLSNFFFRNQVHVELGSGDGRVNFHAIEYGVSESIGIEVDEDVVVLAEERLNRIHPKPNLKFIVSDLMDPESPAWLEHVPRATILTMYFATDGLQKIKPYLEQALRGKKCKIYEESIKW